jgi:hypothetical protein
MRQQSEINELSRDILFTTQRIKSLISDIESQETKILVLKNRGFDLSEEATMIEASREVYKKAMEDAVK